MKSYVKKLIVICAIIALFAIGFGIDAIIASTYYLHVVSAILQEETPLQDESSNPLPENVVVAYGMTH